MISKRRKSNVGNRAGNGGSPRKFCQLPLNGLQQSGLCTDPAAEDDPIRIKDYLQIADQKSNGTAKIIQTFLRSGIARIDTLKNVKSSQRCVFWQMASLNHSAAQAFFSNQIPHTDQGSSGVFDK